MALLLFFLVSTASSQPPANNKIGPRLKNVLDSPSNAPCLVWVYFADKGENAAQKLTAPEQLVSERSLRRRMKVRSYDQVVDYTDLQVNRAYVEYIRPLVNVIRHRSRWLNAVSVEMNPEQVRELVDLQFVRHLELVARFRKPVAPDVPPDDILHITPVQPARKTSSFDYGPSLAQLQQISVPEIHETGNYGQDVIVGVFDNGFRLLSHEAFGTLDILATYDFVDNKVNVVPNNPSSSFGAHGINTLSIIAGFKEGQLIGPAFGATYILARTENDSSETPREEDNWVAAIEWADSIGVDVTSTSLIYKEFDSPFSSWTWADMDGNTTVITRAADLAVSKGIVVVNAAGNFGSSGVPEQNTLGAPADGDSVITVGAVDLAGNRASFSSVGPTANNPPRIKPDVMAAGVGIQVASANDPGGYTTTMRGTSFACPLIAGVVALLLHSYPDATPSEIATALRMTATNTATPDNLIGWGIINAKAALDYLASVEQMPQSFVLRQNYPNPFNPSTTISFDLVYPATISLDIFDLLGREVQNLVNGPLTSGRYFAVWDGRDRRGLPVSGGVYICRLRAETQDGAFVDSRKMVLLR